jgi:hypothetical protein
MPGGQPVVSSVVDGRHGASTRCTLPVTRAGACRAPGSHRDLHTARARTSPYHPIRKATTLKRPAVVDTNRRTRSPARTLSRSV